MSEENEMSQSAPKTGVPRKAAPEQAAASMPPAPRVPAKKTTARKTPAKKAAPAKKTTATKTTAKQTTATKKTPAAKAPAKKTTAKKAPAKKAAPAEKATPTPLPKAPVKPSKAPRAATPRPPATATPAPPDATDLAPPPRVPTPRARAVDPLPQSPALGAETEPVRRSWFSRRPLTFSPTEWTSGWSEKSRPVTRFRTALVVGPLLVALAAAGAYGARLMYADPVNVSVSGPEVTCWDGSRTAAGACPLPTGADGLAWVYPSFDPDDEACTNVLVAHPEYRRPTMWTCETDIHDRPLRITYSELTGVASGLAYHEKLFADGKKSAFPGPRGTVDTYVWRQPEPVDGWYRMASMYVDYPYAVLIEATTLRDRDRAYRDLVRQRDPRHVTTGFD